ncbi:AEC family transporter [Vibrio breoganii]|uniref:AEC family transporter n=1 Tax=Vibrio breoganii TaxID=553239 RepID=UPI0002E6403A|nr:AEC family transporter [Vibrio breoganii]MDN3716690.1 AEC family transporter [Vibrio breoganii]
MQQVQLIGWILVGFMLAKFIHAFNETRVGWVRSFAFAFLTPTLFFGSMVKADFDHLPSLNLVISYLLAMFTLFVLMRLFLAKTCDETSSCSNIKSISALYPNAVGVGVPLIFSLYGTEAELILMGVVFINLVLVLPLFNILMIRSGEAGFYSYRKVASDPIIIAIVTGALINLLSIPLPSYLLSAVDHVGMYALPIILLVLGASLSFYNTQQLLQQKVTMLLFVKMIGFPFIVLCISYFWLQLDLLEMQVLVLLCSLPTGINVYLLAERYQVAREATASVIVGSTGLSLLSVFAWEVIVSRLV